MTLLGLLKDEGEECEFAWSDHMICLVWSHDLHIIGHRSKRFKHLFGKTPANQKTVDSKDGGAIAMESSIAYDDDLPMESNTQPQMKVCVECVCVQVVCASCVCMSMYRHVCNWKKRWLVYFCSKVVAVLRHFRISVHFTDHAKEHQYSIPSHHNISTDCLLLALPSTLLCTAAEKMMIQCLWVKGWIVFLTLIRTTLQTCCIYENLRKYQYY